MTGGSGEDVEAVRQSGLFDGNWYLARYPDAAAGRCALTHYLESGLREGRLPSPLFDPEYYLAAYPDVAAAGLNPLLHYARWGRHEGRRIYPPDLDGAVAAVAFSVILATHDRIDLIDDAIRSMLRQTHRAFELIIVDDGSRDGTEDFVRSTYAAEIGEGRIVFVRFSENLGVCAARNAGLLKARHSWIAYIDSDNIAQPRFLDIFAREIVAHDGARALYARFFHDGRGAALGRAFDIDELRRENHIDLGVFVHHVECFRERGGFDLRLRRLVDWELILRYAKVFPPVFIDEVLLTYRDRHGGPRITTSEPFTLPKTLILRQHKVMTTISTLVLSHDGERDAAQAIESALAQEGEFFHDIILADDGSRDGTAEIVADYVRRYPQRVRSIGDGVHRGYAGNLRRAIEAAAGSYLAVLDGGAAWVDTFTLARRSAFLERNPDCPAVTDAPGIGRLSAGLFRTDLMKRLPSSLFRNAFSVPALGAHLERLGGIGCLEEAPAELST